MPATLDRLWTTPALTTNAALIARSEQAGRMANLIRANRDEWPGLSDEERRAAGCRLLFARWRLNRDDRLRTRVVREGAEMRAEVEGNTMAVLAILLMLAHMAWRRLHGR